MSNDTIVTVRGFAGGQPTTFTNTYNSETGEEFSRNTTLVRIGVTPSYYNRTEEEFRDGQTAWYSVRTYGALARNVAESVSTGTPLVVRGRLTVRSYVDRQKQERSENVILADSVGIELTNGTATYSKRSTAVLEAIAGEPLPRHHSEEDTEESFDASDEVDNSSEDPWVRNDGEPDPAGVLSNV